jgi:hypothetical protein
MVCTFWYPELEFNNNLRRKAASVKMCYHLTFFTNCKVKFKVGIIKIHRANEFTSGSGSVCFKASWIRIWICNCCTDPDQQAKLWIKTVKKLWKFLISTVLWLLKSLLSLKADVNVPAVKNEQKHLQILLASWKPLEKRKGSGFVSKCRRSGTLVETHWFIEAFGHGYTFAHIYSLMFCYIQKHSFN